MRFGSSIRGSRVAFVLTLMILPVTMLLGSIGQGQALSPQEITPSMEKSIDVLISKMTLQEKVLMLGGRDEMNTVAIPRLGIPSIMMNDGPLGVRIDNPPNPTTAFPAGIAMGASFDPDLVGQVSAAIADETRFAGHNMLLGPCVNISRHPFGGRNFESFGEDPYLTSKLAVSYINGVQGQGVLASVKHFALNEQEYERMTVDVHADIRSIFEIHFPAFKAAVDTGSWTVMASYNRVNGHYASENEFNLKTVLKDLWQFKGFVVSDWGATHSTIEAANNGLDLEMPSGQFFDAKLVAAIQAGKVQESLVNDKVRRILRAMYAIGLIDPTVVKPLPSPKSAASPEHHALALKLAQESAVLLKNDGAILPLTLPTDPGQVLKVAVIGPHAATLHTGGGGSSQVDVTGTISPIQAITERFGKAVQIAYAQGTVLPNELNVIPSLSLRPTLGSSEEGLNGEYFDNQDFMGQPLFTRLDKTVDFDLTRFSDPRLKEHFSARWTGFISAPTTGRYRLETVSDDGVRLYFDGAQVISNWSDHGRTVDDAEVDLVAGKWYPVRLEYYQNTGGAEIALRWSGSQLDLLNEAVAIAKAADVTVVFAGLSNMIESEAQDRTEMTLPQGQDEMINAVTKANPNTVVVMTSGNPVSMGAWLPNVKGLLQVWYPGQEGGYAIADLLFGRVNPSGKLPVTFLKRWEDSAAYGNYPGKNGEVEYSEGIFIGYRHFDAHGLTPEFPFGFGLSYTKFALADLGMKVVNANAKSAQVEVSVKVSNVGTVAGAEVAQVYVGELNPIVPRPPKEFKAFKKLVLQPGESQTLKFVLDASAFSYFDVPSMTWKVNPGKFRVSVGTSSRDLPLNQEVSFH